MPTCVAFRPPRQATEQKVTLQASSVAMYSMLQTAISKICHSRGLFPPSDFADVRLIEGYTLHQVLKDSERTKDLRRWMREGILPAIQKQYLDQVVFVISADEAGENVLELYTFMCTYEPTPNAEIPYASQSGIQSQCNALLSQLGALAESTAPLPELPTYMRIELVFNEATPPDYRPPACFSAPRSVEGRGHTFAAAPRSASLLAVRTEHQAVRALLYTGCAEGMWADVEPIGASTVPIGASRPPPPRPSASCAPGSQPPAGTPSASARRAAGSRPGSRAAGSDARSATPSGSAAQSGGAARKAAERYEDAKRACLARGYGAHLNAEILAASVPGLQPLDACMLLCKLEQEALIGPFSPAINARVIIAGAESSKEESGAESGAADEPEPAAHGGPPAPREGGAAAASRAAASDAGGSRAGADGGSQSEPAPSKRPRRELWSDGTRQ